MKNINRTKDSVSEIEERQEIEESPSIRESELVRRVRMKTKRRNMSSPIKPKRKSIEKGDLWVSKK